MLRFSFAKLCILENGLLGYLSFLFAKNKGKCRVTAMRVRHPLERGIMKIKLKVANESYATKDLSKQLSLSDSAVRVLHNRGFNDKRSILNFLNFKPYQLRNVEEMKDAEKFLTTLIDVMNAGLEITIYGDYDGDGVMSTMIWYMALSKLGHKPNWFVNDRFKEGYGMNVKGVSRLLQNFPKTSLIVTCDNGIKANEGIDYAASKGVKTIVSDHHGQSQGESLPNCPVVCEKRLDEDQEKGEWFCGAELSRRLVVALFKRLGLQKEHKEFLNRLYAFSGLATVTDSITMNGANHYVVKEGLRQIGSEKDLCWQVLREETNPSSIDQDTIGFKYGPIINASGRVQGTVDAAMELFLNSFWYEEAKTTDNFSFERNEDAKKSALACRQAALNLISINEERKKLSADGDRIAANLVQENGWNKKKIIVVDDERFEEGINGLIAGHLTEQYQVPAITLSPKDGEPEIYKGSARSVVGFNIFEVLNDCKDLLLGFGGHPGAAGLSIKKDNIPALRARLEKLAEQYVPEPETSVLVDFIITPETLSPRLAQEVAQLMPFGEGFAKPTVGFEGNIKEVRILNNRHLKFVIETSGTPLEIFWWNSIERYNEAMQSVASETPVKIVCSGSAPTYRFDMGKLKAQVYATVVDLS